MIVFVSSRYNSYMTPYQLKALSKIEELAKTITKESTELVKHEDLGISLSGGDINAAAYHIIKYVDEVKRGENIPF